ncbi:MAG: hypothetical protein AB7G75_22815 [Candidatus Binatia bacterium]
MRFCTCLHPAADTSAKQQTENGNDTVKGCDLGKVTTDGNKYGTYVEYRGQLHFGGGFDFVVGAS